MARPARQVTAMTVAATARAGARAVFAGFLGTTAMTSTLWLERRLRRNADGPVDYDASSHVVTAASRVLHVHPGTDRQKRRLFLVVHWGYGSAVGVGYRGLRAFSPTEATATLAFYALCQSMAMTLFPTFGGTPPPWRWKRDMLASSFGQHAVYAIVVALASPRPAGVG
jgi:hypothetical protein